jgi:putative DNA methylase
MADATYRKKLIEVSLPLPEINDASAYDKMPGIGPHPKGIHHWWARLPLPTARAMLFASIVDDPSERPDLFPTDASQNLERERLFEIVRKLMDKQLHAHPEVYAAAHAEMMKHCDAELPAVYDPFAGGGSIPLEASRLGFKAYAADLNPVAVLLNKCNLELATACIGAAPINPEHRKRIGGSIEWRGTQGLAADVRYYGAVVRTRAHKKIGHLYPNVRLSDELGGDDATVIAWIWARTVASPNPAAQGKHVPLMSTYWLSSKKGNQVWLVPVIDKQRMSYRFDVQSGVPNDTNSIKCGTKSGRKGFRCLLTDSPMDFEYIRQQFREGKTGNKLIAIVAAIPRGKTYLPASSEQEAIAIAVQPVGFPDTDLPEEALGFRVQNYGVKHHWQMFTPRQLNAMVTFSDLVIQVFDDVANDARSAGLSNAQAITYARTVVTFLALAIDRCADFNCAFSTWKPSGQQQMHLFTRQAIPMVWDFAEANLLGDKAICWQNAVDICASAVEVLHAKGEPISSGSARQVDAATGADGITGFIVSTDPPYYDNIGYAALSDFFYVWLRRTLGSQYPDLCNTVLVPKSPELTASPERFGGNKEKAKQHFESGFRRAFTALREKMDPRFPLTVYYAFKQDDEVSGVDEEIENVVVDLTTGWETLLEALSNSGFQITGTWPVRASQAWRMRAMGSNALASYIVLVCRPRSTHATLATRKDFVGRLRQELPRAVRNLQHGNIAPVDLAQAAIGPGMATFTEYFKVVESDGKPMSVRTALGLINQTLDEVLAEQEGEFDSDTRWALSWFEQFGMEEGPFGDAETLSKAKNTAITGLQEGGVIVAKGGKVRLVKRPDLPKAWNPTTDKRLTVWEVTQHLIHRLEQQGETGAAELIGQLGGIAEVARDLAYRLYSTCERKKWAQEALAYNSLVVAWPELTKLARQASSQKSEARKTQKDLFS